MIVYRWCFCAHLGFWVCRLFVLSTNGIAILRLDSIYEQPVQYVEITISLYINKCEYLHVYVLVLVLVLVLVHVCYTRTSTRVRVRTRVYTCTSTRVLEYVLEYASQTTSRHQYCNTVLPSR